MAKLFVALALFALCVAVAQATTTISTYSDSGCTTRTGFYSTNAVCSNYKKRAVQGTPVCYEYMKGLGVYYMYNECTGSEDAPTQTVPNGWQSLKYSTVENCNFSVIYDISAVPAVGSNINIVTQLEGSLYNMNGTYSCDNNGVLSVSTCFEYGCLAFQSVPNGVCSNITTTVLDRFYNAIQTSCVAVPMSEPVAEPVAAPVAAPVATPVAAPVKAPTSTPIKSAASAVVGSAFTVLAAALLC